MVGNTEHHRLVRLQDLGEAGRYGFHAALRLRHRAGPHPEHQFVSNLLVPLLDKYARRGGEDAINIANPCQVLCTTYKSRVRGTWRLTSRRRECCAPRTTL